MAAENALNDHVLPWDCNLLHFDWNCHLQHPNLCEAGRERRVRAKDSEQRAHRGFGIQRHGTPPRFGCLLFSSEGKTLLLPPNPLCTDRSTKLLHFQWAWMLAHNSKRRLFRFVTKLTFKSLTNVPKLR